MKKICFLLICCFIALTASAQKITEKQLLGEWKVRAVTMNGDYYNFKNDSISLAEKTPDGPPRTKEQRIRAVKQSVTPFKSIHVIFEAGLNLIFSFDANRDPGSLYTLTEKDGKYFIKTADSAMEYEVYLKKGLLYWLPNQGPVNMIFEKL